MENREYIERSEALSRLTGKARCVNSPGKVRAFATAINVIETMPAADVEPVRHGRWIHVPGKQTRVCSRCETDEPYKFADEDTDIYSWCPHCGAKMDGEA